MDVALAKAISVRQALSWLKSHSLENMILETDSLNVFINAQKYAPNYFGAVLIDGCKSMLKHTTHCNMIFVRRSANNIAQLSPVPMLIDTQFWSSAPPSFICEQLLSEAQ